MPPLVAQDGTMSSWFGTMYPSGARISQCSDRRSSSAAAASAPRSASSSSREGPARQRASASAGACGGGRAATLRPGGRMSQHGTTTVEREFVGLPSPWSGGRRWASVPGLSTGRPAGSRRRPSSPPTTTSTSRALRPITLAARGFGFLGWNTRFRGAEAYFLLDHASPRSVSVSAGCASWRESSGSCCSARRPDR